MTEVSTDSLSVAIGEIDPRYTPVQRRSMAECLLGRFTITAREPKRSPTYDDAVADLEKAGPGGICGDCGHFAGRHTGMECRWPESTCICKGMLWQGHRIEMRDDFGGPVR